MFKKFKREDLKIIYKHFDIIYCIYENNNWMNSKELSEDLDISEQRIILKVSELKRFHLLKIGSFKKTNNLRSRQHYDNILDDNFIKEFNEFIKCDKCNCYCGKFGGIIHTNVCSETPHIIFCSKECRDEYFDKNNKS